MCLKDFTARSFDNDGFVGLSARNDASSANVVDLKSLTLVNMDTDSYRDEADLIDPSSELYKQLD